MCRLVIFSSIDSKVETPDTPNELDILNNLKNKNYTTVDCDEDEEDEHANYHDSEINKSSHEKNLKSFETIRHRS